MTQPGFDLNHARIRHFHGARQTAIIAVWLISFLAKEALVTSVPSYVSIDKVIQDSSLIIVAERVLPSPAAPPSSLSTSFRVTKVLYGGKEAPAVNSVIDV